LRLTEAELLIEPFAGGGIVSLTAVMEDLVQECVMVELDHDVSAFWHAALRYGRELGAMVQNFEPTREVLQEWQSTAPGSVKDHGFRTLVLNRTKRSGILAAGASFMKSGEGGKGLLSRWYPATLARRLEAIASFSGRIAFFEGDGTRLLPLILQGQEHRTAVFLDPPYTAGGKRAGRRLYNDSWLSYGRIWCMGPVWSGDVPIV